MATNYESAVINGQLVPTMPAQTVSPLTYGTSLSGPGFWPAGTQYNVPPLLPSASATTGATEYSPSNNGVLPTVGSISSNGNVNYFHPTKSPIAWVVATLILALFLLHKVHYGK